MAKNPLNVRTKIMRVTPPERSRIIGRIRRFDERRTATPKCEVLVLGDGGVASNDLGEVLGVCAEAPLPRIGIAEEHLSLDGVCGIASMLKDWGLAAVAASPVGSGRLSSLKLKLLDKEGLLHVRLSTGLPQTTRFTRRVFAGGHQLSHFESEETLLPGSGSATGGARAALRRRLARAGMLCIVDQGSSGLSDDVLLELSAHARRQRARVLYEPRFSHLLPGGSFDIIKLNHSQLSQWHGGSVDSEEAALAAVESILKGTGSGSVICTRGEKGILVYQRSNRLRRAFIIAPRPKAIFDLVSAGDIVTAAIAFCVAKGRSILEAACFATTAAELSLDQRHDKHLTVQSILNYSDP